MTRSLYAYSASARRTLEGGRVHITSGPGVAWAINEAEAVGLAIEEFRGRYPASEGWHSHEASAFRVPDEILARASGH
jgi:hypothetical protein